MSYSKVLKSRLLYKVTSSDEVNDFTRKMERLGHVIVDVEYHSNARFVVSYLRKEDSEELEELRKKEETQKAIVKSLVRDVSKVLTNTVSEDVYCKIVNPSTSEVSNQLSSNFLEGVVDNIQDIFRSDGLYEVRTSDGMSYILTRL